MSHRPCSIRIAIADDHPMIINGLQNMLLQYPHICLTATYADGEELMEGLKLDVPDVLLLDIQLPGKTGDELAPLLLRDYTRLRILTLTNFDSVIYVNSMFRNGVLGYLLKTTDQRNLITAIETVSRGEQFIEPSLREKMERLAPRMQRGSGATPQLTLREKQILQLIVNGHTSQEIAERLFLSHYTVENYRGKILFKLDASNMAMLIRKALTMGLVS